MTTEETRAAFETAAPLFQINIERSKPFPDRYKYEHSEHMWRFWQAAALAALASAPDPVVEANRQLLLDRSRVGVAKYGATLADANLTRDALVRHALEEALDLANYLQALLQC